MSLNIVAVVLVLCLIGDAAAVSCVRESDCRFVSEHRKFVQCVAGQCACLTENGFIGNATTSSKCDCNSPNTVYWNDDRDPFCVQLENAVTYANQQARSAILRAKITQIYESLIYPTPAIIMGAIIQGVPPTSPAQPMSQLFAPNASGRVDPVGEFFNFDGVVEYFYGAVWINTTTIVDIFFKKLTVEGNQVTVRVDLTMELYMGPTLPPLHKNLTQSGVFTFNDDNLVQKVELIVHNLAWSNVDRPQLDIPTLCHLIVNVAGCNETLDPLGFYDDVPTCMAFMNSIEFGEWDYVRSNTVVCRLWHMLLALGRPQVHCPHTGRSGGGKCVFHPYDDYYKIDF